MTEPQLALLVRTNQVLRADRAARESPRGSRLAALVLEMHEAEHEGPARFCRYAACQEADQLR